ncbi:MAG: BamA/TamA family outer membrane protein [Bacteroidales bacterium]|nr:BamA/TamA family outer membrane protein [Bacteroidales bacterium]
MTNRLEQRNHMETTYATNDFYNQKNDNCDVDLAGTAPAQFIIASISGGKARFGYTYGAKNDYQTAPSMQFVIDTTPDLASSDLFTYDAGSFKGEALYRTFTEPDLKSNVNGMIQHFKDESDKMLQHVAFDGDAVFNASTGAIDFSDECYKNTTLYINVQPGSRLESAIQATEGLNIIKDPSTVVVFNILNTDYIKLAKYKVTSDNMTMDTYTDHSGDDSEKNKNIDKYITRKIIWNVPYAQYVRGELQLGQTIRLGGGEGQAVALRFLIGAGYGYGNSTTVPFEKQFYAGGASSMRGWQARALGPGGVEPWTEYFLIPSQTGDFKMEANIEYRFPIVWKLEGALFADMGNVWELRKSEWFSNSSFSFDTIAADWGLGIRVNLDFILVRIDMGTKVYEPCRPADERLIGPAEWLKRDNFALHFGVRYPF